MSQQRLIDLVKEDPQLHSDLAKLTVKWPQLTERAVRAAIYFLDGQVEITPAGDYYVTSKSRGIIYSVVGQSGTVSCTCPDIRNGAPIGPGNVPWCKHMLSAVFFYRDELRQQEA